MNIVKGIANLHDNAFGQKSKYTTATKQKSKHKNLDKAENQTGTSRTTV